MKEISIDDLKTIFGKNKRGKYFIDIYEEKYPILKNNDVFRWLTTKISKFAQKTNKQPKDFNVTSYLKALNDYCNHNKVSNPSELLQENIDNRNKRLVDYLVYLIKVKGLNEVSVKNAYQSRIKSFFSARGFPITDGLETEDSGINHNEMSLTRDKIQAILNMINNSNYKLASKIQSLLGLRIGDVLKELPKYKILEFESEIDNSKHYYIKNFLTIKENVRIKYLFFPKELTKLLQAIYQIKDLTHLDLSSKLLKTRKSEKKGGKVILSSEYLRKLKVVAKKLYPNEVMRSHSFRKYFATQISRVNLTKIRNDIGSDVESNFKEHLLGHKVHYSSKVYNQIINDINQFYELWKPLEASLCIDCEIVNTTNQDILDLKEQIIKLKDQNDDMLRERSEFKEKIEKLEEITSKIPNLLEAYESMKINFIELRKESNKDVSDKEIIDKLGLKEIPKKSSKKLKLNK